MQQRSSQASVLQSVISLVFFCLSVRLAVYLSLQVLLLAVFLKKRRRRRQREEWAMRIGVCIAVGDQTCSGRTLGAGEFRDKFLALKKR
jgi:hypothetical protein